MRKWTYLVAALLMAGTTATFTGCIDTDEPEGITNLRGAKSELIKAQAAVELVEVEMQKAKVANQELLNKAQELANQKAEYDNQLKALEVKKKELEIELQQAQNEADKARFEAEIAQSNKNKADLENQMAVAAEAFKKEMLAAQEATARAQASYDLAMEEIELAKLTLSENEQKQVKAAQDFLASATSTMNGKYATLKEAQTAYYDALVDESQVTEASLRTALKKAQIEVEKAEIMLAEKNNMLALAEDFDAASWDAKIKELDKKISEQESEQSKALYRVEEIKAKSEYKEAQKKVDEKNKARKEAKVAYEKAAADSTEQYDNAKLYLKSYKSEPINAALRDLFEGNADFTSSIGNNGYDVQTGVFSYTFAPNVFYTQKDYEADLLEDEEVRTTLPSTTLRTVEAWQKAVGDYTVDQNGVEWNEVRLAGLEANADKKKEDYDKKFALWEISVKAVKGTATSVPTTDLKKATDAYNTSYTTLVDAVTAYNTAYDKTYKVAYDKYVTDTKKVKENSLYIVGLEALLAGESTTIKGEYDAWSTGKEDAEKITKLVGYLTILSKTAEIAGEKAKAETKTSEFYAIPANLTALENGAKNAGQTALTNSDDVKAAQKALDKANADVVTALSEVSPAIGAYKILAATPYGQILAKQVTLDDLTGSGAFYEDEKDKDGNLTGHKKALRSDISNDEFAKLSETKLDSQTAEAALVTTSSDVFGSHFSDRLVEVTEAMVRAYIKQNGGNLGISFGALGVMMAANDDVQLCKDKIAAKKLIEPLIAQLADVKAGLEKEIEANTALMEPFIAEASKTSIALKDAKAEVKAAEEERDALTAEDQEKADQAKELIGDYGNLKLVAQNQIDAINNGAVVGGTSVTVESIIAYWKGVVASQEETVAQNIDAVKLAEKRLELFNNNEDSRAYELQQKHEAIVSAQAEYEKAQSVYKMAFAQLEALLAALTK